MFTSLTAFLLLATPPQAAIKADIIAVKRVYPAFTREFNAKNWAKVSKSIADDFVHETPTHEKSGKDAFIKERTATLAPFKNMRFKATKLWDFKTTPAGTSVELSWVMNAILADKTGKHKAHATGTELHLWKKTNGKWLMEAIVEHQSTTWIDGKVVDEQPPKK